MTFGSKLNIFYLRIFGCIVYIAIEPTQQIKMGPQRRLRIYIWCDSPLIIRYLKPLTRGISTSRFIDCHFDENFYPKLGVENKWHKKELAWKTSLTYLDPQRSINELEVQKIMHLQQIANQLFDSFVDSCKVTKLHIPSIDAHTRIEVLIGQNINSVVVE